MGVLLPALYVGCLGLFFGLVLSIAAKAFHVEVDEKITKIIDVLPGANCGACGFPGCGGFAQGVVDGSAATDACIPGGKECTEKISEIMGTKSKPVKMKNVARLLCAGSKANSTIIAEYSGIQDCKASLFVHGAGKICTAGCVGFGNCANVCPFSAITMNENGLPVVDTELCTGCGICVTECPRDLLELVPMNKTVYVGCKSTDPGKEVRKYCEIGCIGCKICEKVCPVEYEVDGEKRKAIKVENNIATIDYEKCISCGKCVEKCPRNVIFSLRDHKSMVAEIDQNKCVKCTICIKNCKFDAIEGKIKEKHVIIKDNCISCGVCIDKCPKNAIEFIPR